jgi:epoxide hydrolase-like predicted phosphatase
MKLSEGLDISSSEIKNIIFDWGGVITDLHFERTVSAFHKLGFPHFEDSLTHPEILDLYLRLEVGKIDEADFLIALRKYLNKDVADSQILSAWNAILGDLPAERWMLLKEVKQTYRTFLLSNTNSIHISNYFQRLENLYGMYGFDHLFEKVYFSHLLGMKKPDRGIYEFVLQDSHLDPSETLFIDDNRDNIETARQMGIKGYHLIPPATLVDLFE